MTKLRPFRFGVICEHMQSAEEWLTKARQAEEYGYATLLIRDHFIREPFGDQLAPLIALMAAASATKTLRVGSLVLDNDYRHPVMLAKEAATLDLLSGGRFELGIGAGWLRSEYEQAGMVFEPAGVRVSRLEEAIQVLKGPATITRSPTSRDFPNRLSGPIRQFSSGQEVSECLRLPHGKPISWASFPKRCRTEPFPRRSRNACPRHLPRKSSGSVKPRENALTNWN